MFSLPVIFICNTIFFVFVMEERFKVVTTMAASAVGLILSVISGLVVDSMVSDAALAGTVANGISVFWLLVISVFIASNNIGQKLFTGLMLVLNYAFFTGFIPHLLGAMPFSSAGIMAVLLGNGLYILLSLLSMSLVTKPLHYFYRRGVSPFIIFLCVLQAGALFLAQGGLNDYLKSDSFGLQFFAVLFMYIIIIFSLRSAYGGAKYKAKDVLLTSSDKIMAIQADNFGDMLMNVESFKSAKKNVEYAFDRIRILAEAGKTSEVADYAKLAIANNRTSPLLDNYSDDEYINAIVATKSAEAAEKGIRIESNISVGDTSVDLIYLCIIINDLLNIDIKDSARAEGEKFVRLNILPAQNQLTIESVHSTGTQESEGFSKRTAYDFIRKFFAEKGEESTDEMNSIRLIVEQRSGKINVSRAEDTTITRIGINY